MSPEIMGQNGWVAWLRTATTGNKCRIVIQVTTQPSLTSRYLVPANLLANFWPPTTVSCQTSILLLRLCLRLIVINHRQIQIGVSFRVKHMPTSPAPGKSIIIIVVFFHRPTSNRHTIPMFLLLLLLAISSIMGLSCVHHRGRRQFSSSPPSRLHASTVVDKEPSAVHSVEGVKCIQVKSTLPDVGEISILEATADSQEDLVNLALDEAPTDMSLTLSHADPYGAVLWPAATAVARTILLEKHKWLENKVVCELGAGTGLVSLAAAAGGASKVIATDYESIPLKLLEYAQMNLNPLISTQNNCIETRLLDLCLYESMPLPEADVYLTADVMYEPKTGQALAHRVVEALQRGSRVLIGDSPGRAGRPAFLKELHRLGVMGDFVEVPGWTVTGDRHELICGRTSTSVSVKPRHLQVALMELGPDALSKN